MDLFICLAIVIGLIIGFLAYLLFKPGSEPNTKPVVAQDYLHKLPKLHFIYEINIIEPSGTDPAMEPRNMRY